MAEVTLVGQSGANAGKEFTVEEGTAEFKQLVDFGFTAKSTGENPTLASVGDIPTPADNNQFEVSDFTLAPNIKVADGQTGVTVPPAQTDPVKDFAVDLSEASLSDAERQRANINRERQGEAEKEKAAAEEAQRGRIEERENIETEESAFRRLRAEAGIDEKEQRLDSIFNQIDQQKAALGLAKVNEEGRVIAMDFITGRQALLERQAGAKIAALSSQAAVVERDLTRASNLLAQFYQASAMDRQNKRDNLNQLIQWDREDIIRLDDKEQAAIDTQLDVLDKAEERERADKEKITSLMLENPVLWQKANVSLDMTFEEIATEMTKVAKEAQREALEESSVADLQADYPDAGIQLTDSLAQAQAKLPLSKIYRQATRLADVPAGGVGGEDGELDDATVADFLAAIRTIEETPTLPDDQVGLVSGTTEADKQALLDDVYAQAIEVMSGTQFSSFLEISDPTRAAAFKTTDIVQRPEGLYSLTEQRILTPDETTQYFEDLKKKQIPILATLDTE